MNKDTKKIEALKVEIDFFDSIDNIQKVDTNELRHIEAFRVFAASEHMEALRWLFERYGTALYTDKKLKKTVAREYKSRLPVFMPTVRTGNARTEYERFTGFYCVDIDDFFAVASLDELDKHNEFVKYVMQETDAIAAQLSARGNGFMLLYFDSAVHGLDIAQEAFFKERAHAFEAIIKDKLKQIDETLTVDNNAPCWKYQQPRYLSPFSFYVNGNYTDYVDEITEYIDKHAKELKEAVKQPPTLTVVKTNTQAQSSNIYDALQEALQEALTKGIDVAGSYSEWIRGVFAIKSHFGQTQEAYELAKLYSATRPSDTKAADENELQKRFYESSNVKVTIGTLVWQLRRAGIHVKVSSNNNKDLDDITQAFALLTGINTSYYTDKAELKDFATLAHLYNTLCVNSVKRLNGFMWTRIAGNKCEHIQTPQIAALYRREACKYAGIHAKALKTTQLEEFLLQLTALVDLDINTNELLTTNIQEADARRGKDVFERWCNSVLFQNLSDEQRRFFWLHTFNSILKVSDYLERHGIRAYQTAPVLLGAGGVGKTTLCVNLGKLVSSVVGFDVCTSIRNLDTTDRDTATLLASALVVYADEITGLNTDKSRELITKPKLHLRQLYTHTELKINNVASYWFTSNDSRKVIEDAANNRRFIVLSMKGLDFESIQSISESSTDARNLFAYVHSLNIDILESQKYLEKLAEGANDTLNTVEAQVNYVLNTYFKTSIVDKDESKRTVKVESVDNATIEKLQRLIEQCKVKHLLYKDGAGYITDTLLTWLVAAVMEKIGHGTDYKDVKAALENIKSQRLEHTELALRRGYTVVWTRGNELFNAQPKTGFFLVPSLDAFGEIFEHLEGTDAWLKS